MNIFGIIYLSGAIITAFLTIILITVFSEKFEQQCGDLVIAAFLITLLVSFVWFVSVPIFTAITFGKLIKGWLRK